MTLSVIVITKNGEATIRRCLASVAWADEIVVLDSGSTDRTLEISRELGAAVHVTPDWPGCGPQRNRAIERTRGEWLLALDQDEWASPELGEEIRRVVADPGGHAGFAMPRCSSFCGRFMRHSGWWPDYITRLFRRDAGRYSDDHLHDRAIVDGATRRLRHPIMHEAITDLDQMIAKMNSYSSVSAVMFDRQGRSASLATAMLHGWWAFTRTYFLRLGFLDGREGFMLAVANAEGSYYRYLKLAQLTRAKRDR
jgi:glycosyltransferase involved in cell wall biosynthesis